MTKISDEKLAEIDNAACDHMAAFGNMIWDGVSAEEAHAIISELQQLRAHNSDSAEPVAWRWRSPQFQDGWWQLTDVAPTNPQDHIEYQPLYLASPPAKDVNLLKAARKILPYLEWTISDESPGYHPTMPSAVAAFKAALTNRTPDDEVGNE